MKTSIGLCMIVKNDDDYRDLKRCLESFQGAFDSLYVTVNGSPTEKIEELLKEYNAVYEIVDKDSAPELFADLGSGQKFANFAGARNRSFALVNKVHDYLMWADTDDFVKNPEYIRLAAEMGIEQKADAIFFPYHYAVEADLDNNGRPTQVKKVIIDHSRERLIKPNKFKWVSRLHEVCVPIDNFKPKNVEYQYDSIKNEGCVWIHLPDPTKPAQNLIRNSEILEYQFREEEQKDPRTAFNLAKVYFDLSQTDKENAPIWLDKCKDLIENNYLIKSGWDEERSNALEYLGLIYERLGNLTKAIECYHKGISEFPNNHLIYTRLINAYYNIGNKSFGDFWLGILLKMDPPKTRTTIGNPYQVKLAAAMMSWNKAKMENNVNEMYEWAKAIANLTGDPQNPLYLGSKEAKEMNDAAVNVWQYANWLKNENRPDLIEKLLDALPEDLSREAFASFIRTQMVTPKVWPKKSIVYYASFGGPAFEPWSPKSLKKGIGGSETAVIKLAEEWVKLGYSVTVFGEPDVDEGEHDGVMYLPWHKINWNDTFDTLILWRSPHLLDREIKANRLYMDLHDIASQTDWSEERMNKVHKVFFKSNWHRMHLPKLPDSKCVVISNGIE